MNKHLIALLAALLIVRPVFGEDLPAPRPATDRVCRILLYVNGSERALDYGNVVKVHELEANKVTFETSDGLIILHHGPFTLIGPKSQFVDHSTPGGGVRFFDAK